MRWLVVLLCSFCLTSYGQEYIRLVGDTGVRRVDAIREDGDQVIYQIGRNDTKVAKEQVEFVEYKEGGLVYFNKTNIRDVNTPELKRMAKETPQKLLKEGNKVYIPYSSERIAGRWGAIYLRELIRRDGYWTLVDCDLEAEFILRYNIDVDKDKAWFTVHTRSGKEIYASARVKAKDLIPRDAAKESVERLVKQIEYLKMAEANGLVTPTRK